MFFSKQDPLSLNFHSPDIRQKFLQSNYSLFAFLKQSTPKKSVILVKIGDLENIQFELVEQIERFKNLPQALRKAWEKDYEKQQKLLVAFQLDNEKNPKYYHALGSSTFPLAIASQLAQQFLQKANFIPSENSTHQESPKKKLHTDSSKKSV